MSDTPSPVPAAQYLRVSTEHQQYSLTNQSAGIAEYAAQHGFKIVETYEDAARSGVVLRGRHGLKRLLRDVVDDPPFKAILVYDISRWGRFQDVDESAHYEFICKSSGVPISYCAEQFANDGSLTSLLAKSLKRAMAAEYSRELGEKVHRGQKRLTEMGFKMGGSATFGLRRLMVSATGKPKQLLRKGERKSLSTDRVVYVLGPAREVAIVRTMFDLVLRKGYRAQQITAFLNAAGLKNVGNVAWSRDNVEKILRSPKYYGCNVWARSTSRLHTRMKRTPKKCWISKAEAFPPIIDEKIFDKVQVYLDSWYWSDEELLDGLREVWKREGSITQEILSRVRYGPCFTTCVAHFGTFGKALAMIGYRHRRNFELARKRSEVREKMHRALVMRIARMFPKRVTVIRKPSSPRRILMLDDNRKISILLAPSRYSSPGTTSWLILPRDDERQNLTLCCMLDKKNESVVGMYFVQSLPGPPLKATVWPKSSWFFGAVRLRSLSGFCRVAGRIVEGRSHEIWG